MKRHVLSAEHTSAPILEVLRRVLPPAGDVLEVASGTGQHAVHFARALRSIVWHPSDADPAQVASIESYWTEAALPNLRHPVLLDATSEHWDVAASFAAVVNIDMVHVSPWAACVGLLSGAARHLRTGGRVLIHDSWIAGGRTPTAAEQELDATLRRESSAWGLRRVDDAVKAAKGRGFELLEVIELPAGKSIVVLRRM